MWVTHVQLRLHPLTHNESFYRVEPSGSPGCKPERKRQTGVNYFLLKYFSISFREKNINFNIKYNYTSISLELL